MEVSPRRVAYYYDPDVGSYSYGMGHPMRPLRMRITHELLTAYDLLPQLEVLVGVLPRVQVPRAKRATPQQMAAFHTDEYVHFLNRVTPETVQELTYHGTRFLVGDDNPAFDGIFEFCSISAGGTIAAANRLLSGHSDIAINWAGGLHHAKKREASGFCYVNDIVLGILELLRQYPRVLYVDIDCHHGDGVEEAFYTTDRVMTCSFHKYGEYFPGTGLIEDRGYGKGKGYAVNVPLKDGLSDESFKSIFQPVVQSIMERFRPSAVVLQCGSDSLAGDKLGCFNISMHGHASCVQFIRKFNIPLILLGGGGYTVKNASRTWAYETACALGVENQMSPMLPWNEFFEWFGPRYRLEVVANNAEDHNLKEEEGNLKNVMTHVLENLRQLPPAPSVQLQDVPRENLGDHLGVWQKNEREAQDELDLTIAHQAAHTYSLRTPLTQPDGFEPQSSSSSSDTEPESDASTYSATRRRRQRVKQARKARMAAKSRMSILSNSWYDVPPLDHFGFYDRDTSEEDSNAGKASAARKGATLWHSGVRWDPQRGEVVVQEALDMRLGIGDIMERGGSAMSVNEGGGHGEVNVRSHRGAQEDSETGSEDGEGVDNEDIVKQEDEEDNMTDDDDDDDGQ